MKTIQTAKIISVLTEHTGETIDMGLIMNLLVEMETRNTVLNYGHERDGQRLLRESLGA